MTIDFLRYCEVIIGPLADWQGGGKTNDGVRIVANGTGQGLRVSFKAKKTLTGDPNEIELIVYNLSRTTRQQIRGNLARVEVYAGYETSESSRALVASGGLLVAYSEREGADIATRMKALDGYGGMVRGSYSRAFGGDTPLGKVVTDVARALPGVTVPDVVLPGRTARKGVVLSGSTTQQLNKLADQHGFSWSVQDGVFQAVPDAGDSGRSFSFASDVNLLSVAPLVDGPTSTVAGIEIISKFEARVKPGDLCTVKSDISPDLSGTYKATTVTLQFDSHGPALTTVQCMGVLKPKPK